MYGSLVDELREDSCELLRRSEPLRLSRLIDYFLTQRVYVCLGTPRQAGKDCRILSTSPGKGPSSATSLRKSHSSLRRMHRRFRMNAASYLRGHAFSLYASMIVNSVTSWKIFDACPKGTKPCTQYYAEFMRLMATLKWDDASKIFEFRNRLREAVNDLLIIRRTPATFDDFVQLYIIPGYSWLGREQERRRTFSGSQTTPPPPPILIDGELEYEVEQIIDSRYRRRRLQ
ncbi:hypothetical protein V1525DRAFT_444103 [Lipomyces kononenkoae]|uniref:Uncharacterized protein n=1 Tax=Lipomyces kononenkoae TaxID=34357 RepID=A0ACC3TA62_LIPKO